MAPIIFPPTSAPGTRPQESGGRLINAFAEKSPIGAPSQVIHRRSPGIERLVQHADRVHTRGFLDAGSEAYWILDDRVVKFNSSFVITDLGSLSGTELVTTARNNAGTPNNLVVTENGCFNLLTAGAPTSFADGDLPASPTSVCDINGYFVWTFGDGRVFASDLNSVAVNSLSFTTEQRLFCRRGVSYAGRLYIFGDKWTGVYRDVGASPFPFTREVTIPRGIVGTHAIAGWEPGWANELIWVGDDFVVYKLQGYTPVTISTDDVSRDIQEAVLGGDRDLISASVYMFGKNAFWVLTCRDRWTWEYNLTTDAWNERKSFTRAGWKGSRSLRMFDRWLIGDEYSGELYEISGTYFAEGTDPLVWHVESAILHNFPSGSVIGRSSFNCTAAVGDFSTPGGDDPKVLISWSLDGGFSYGYPVVRRLGAPGNAKSHPFVLNCGLSRGQGVRYRLRVSDPVHVGLSGGVVETEQRGFAG